MTGNLLIDSLISLGAIGVMVLIAWVMFRTSAAPLDETAARARLALDEPDYRPKTWFFDGQGRAALSEGDNGDFALVFRLGDDLVTRRFPQGGARIAAKDGVLQIDPADPGAGAVSLCGEDAALWARKLEGKA